MEQARSLFSPSSGATAEENEIAEKLMCKRTIFSLAKMFASIEEETEDAFQESGLLPVSSNDEEEPEPEAQDIDENQSGETRTVGLDVTNSGG